MGFSSYWEALGAAQELAKGGRHREAFEIMRDVSPRFPQWASQGILEQVVFASAVDPDRAVELVRGALESGYRYPRKTLLHDDFKALFDHPGYREVVEHSDATAERAQAASRPVWKAFRPSEAPATSGYPTLVVLQGNNSNLELTEPHWAGAADGGTLVVVLQPAGITYDPEYFSWQSPEQAREQVLTQLEEVARDHPVDRDRLALGGFSMGAHCATQIAFDGLPARVLITFASFVADPDAYRGRSAAARARGLRAHLVVGEGDPQLENNRRLADVLRGEGVAVELDERPALGHEYPQDAPQTVARALLSPEAQVLQ